MPTSLYQPQQLCWQQMVPCDKSWRHAPCETWFYRIVAETGPLQYLKDLTFQLIIHLFRRDIFPGYPVCKAYWGFPGNTQESRLHRLENTVGDWLKPRFIGFFSRLFLCQQTSHKSWDGPLSFPVTWGSCQVNSLSILDLAVLAFSSSMWDEPAIRLVDKMFGKIWVYLEYAELCY